jgi:hypothetical protein
LVTEILARSFFYTVEWDAVNTLYELLTTGFKQRLHQNSLSKKTGVRLSRQSMSLKRLDHTQYVLHCLLT